MVDGAAANAGALQETAGAVGSEQLDSERPDPEQPDPVQMDPVGTFY